MDKPKVDRAQVERLKNALGELDDQEGEALYRAMARSATYLYSRCYAVDTSGGKIELVPLSGVDPRTLAELEFVNMMSGALDVAGDELLATSD